MSAALGAYIAASAGGTFNTSRGVPPGQAFIGGFLMLFGSRSAASARLTTLFPTNHVFNRSVYITDPWQPLCRFQPRPHCLHMQRRARGAFLSRIPQPSSLDMHALPGAAAPAGGRMAGGCTSGHGLSGMALLSLQSLLGVPAMFAGGIVTAFAFNAAVPAAFIT